MKHRGGTSRWKRPRLRLRTVIIGVALVGVAIAVANGPLHRARWFLWRNQPVRAWEELIPAARSEARDRLLVRALAAVLAESEFSRWHPAAAITASCLAPAAAECIPQLLERVRAEPAALLEWESCALRALGILSRSEPRATEAILLLVREAPETWCFLWGPRLALTLQQAGAASTPLLTAAVAELAADPTLGLRLEVVLLALALRDAPDSAPADPHLAGMLAGLAVDCDRPPQHRRLAALALSALGERGAPALPILVTALDSVALDEESLGRLRAAMLEPVPDPTRYLLEPWTDPAWWRDAGVTLPSRLATDPAAAEALCEIECLYVCISALGTPARGAAPRFVERVAAVAPEPWIPPLLMLYAALLPDEAVTASTVRLVADSPEAIEQAFARLVLQVTTVDDPAALVVWQTADVPRLWHCCLPLFQDRPAVVELLTDLDYAPEPPRRLTHEEACKSTGLSRAHWPGDPPTREQLDVLAEFFERGRALELELTANLAWLAKQEGRELEAAAALALAERKMSDADARTANAAGRLVAALRPRHPGLAAWQVQMLEDWATERFLMTPGMEHAITVIAKLGHARELAPLILQQLRECADIDACWQLAELLRVLEDRPDARPEELPWW